jgi:hypothetical protein
MNILRLEKEGWPGPVSFLPRFLFGVGGQAEAIIPDSARYEHDTQQRSTGGNPLSEHKNSELSHLLPFTLAATSISSRPPGEKRKTERPSWNRACI